jgi:AmmeMemoRadiSam system protein B/AmmeMemoRadiSam system radical SAM enzyme/AmmeMemoRadiSam system protein A
MSNAMKTRVANETLAEALDRHTVVGAPELCRAEGDRLRCLACGHRCLIGEGLRGICKVRFNEGGRLKVPFGYVAGLQCDPVEKKPFFHVYPGSDALTFGMMGCDLHCGYCFPGDTPVVTDRGPITLAEAFQSAPRIQRMPDAEIAYPDGLRAVSGSGTFRSVRAVFKHPYRGRLTVLRPYYLPELRCTPDHRVYATTDPALPPQPIKAGELGPRHFLAIPRQHAFSSARVVDAGQELADHQVEYRVAWDLSPEQRQWIIDATARGETSRQIGAALGKSSSYIRHVRSKLARGQGTDVRAAGVLVEEETVRFPNEHRPGIARVLPLDVKFARLLGFYCAEGCITRGKKRPNSHTLNFSFSSGEGGLVDEVCQLLHQVFGLKAQRVQRSTTLAVAVSKSSAALLFKWLAGSGAATKCVPRQLFEAPRELVQAFLEAYLQGDGHRYSSGKVTATTVSRKLAYGVAFLALKLGYLPSVYDYPMSPEGTVQGRTVTRSPHQYSVVWYEEPPGTRKVVETEQHFLVPLREVYAIDYDGDVYNMEVEEEHNYLAGLFLVSNCQNWVTSQALRDSSAVAPIRPVTPEQLIDVARRERAGLVVSSYNEPLITAEWAVAVFREAAGAGLACAFVSNGNATPEVLDYLRPWIVAYKVDLKSFNDTNYRSLGGTLENITRTIRLVHERGLWLEVVTLIIPGFNDADDELRQAADFLASVSPDIPWHVTAFHKDYKMTDPASTTPDTLVRAAEIGTAAGLRSIYAGNLPGQVGPWENTRCPSCRATVIERFGYLIRAYRLTPEGRCPHCNTRVPGIWPGAANEVRTGNDLTAYRSRLPRRVTAPAAAPPANGPRSLPSIDTPLPAAPGGSLPMATTEPAAPVAPPAAAPNLTPEQKEQILEAAAVMMRDLVAGRPAAFPADLAEVARLTVAGAFVSLKRGGHLRSCCGLLGQPVSLQRALEHAAARTATEDVRFPPVSPTEIDHLEMEVWLLHSPRPVQVRGEARLEAISVGRHGIQVMRGQAHGLFLPSVPVEGKWDVRKFLDQVCIKAGLPPTAWLEDATLLSTFEGEALYGRLAGPDGPAPAPRRPAFCRPEDVPAYVDFCRSNLAALLSGATPSYYFWGAPDGTVNGIVLGLSRPGTTEAAYFSQFQLRPGLPLQSTLFALVQAAAQNLAAQRITPEVFHQLRLGVTFLHDPVLHGTVADPHLAGLEPAHRAIMVLERNKAAVVFDPQRSAEELLAEAAAQARVTHPTGATVYSLDALTNAEAVTVSTAPRPVRGPAVRPPAVAGTFYDAEPADLARTVDCLLEGERRPEAWAAALVPHAGLKFSGRVAADVLRRLKYPRDIIVIGPKHTPLGMEWAVAPHGTWALPGAEVAADFMMARRLSQAIPGLEMDAAAHQREHAIEVELPLLARLAPESRVTGIVIGHADRAACKRFAEHLANFLRTSTERPLLIVSSDMNHFATDAENRRLDALALEALERGDPDLVYETVTKHNISMCGVLPAVIVLEALRLLGGGTKAERVGYATTADVTGDTSRVVGYGGMLFA